MTTGVPQSLLTVKATTLRPIAINTNETMPSLRRQPVIQPNRDNGRCRDRERVGNDGHCCEQGGAILHELNVERDEKAHRGSEGTRDEKGNDGALLFWAVKHLKRQQRRLLEGDALVRPRKKP